MDPFTAFLWWFIFPMAAFGTWWSLFDSMREAKRKAFRTEGGVKPDA